MRMIETIGETMTATTTETLSKAVIEAATVTKNSRQAGFIIPDFIFAILLASGIGILLFSISYSLAVVEVTQYVSYSTARAQLGANKDPGQQKDKGVRKYESLINSGGAIASIYKNGWFTIAKSQDLDFRGGQTSTDSSTFNEDLAGGSGMPGDRDWFIGVSIPLTIKLMQLNLPLLGSTSPEHENGFQTHINTMLIRESSTQECRDFMNQRRSQLANLPSGTKFYDQGAYVPMEDNGC